MSTLTLEMTRRLKKLQGLVDNNNELRDETNKVTTVTAAIATPVL